MDTLIGTSVGGYTLTQFLGSGGMGTVYLAQDPAIGQQVAIKIIRTDSADIPDASAAARALERFKQEARAVASLDHLHILPLYRYGEEQSNNGQRAYMVMQYRPEGSLWDWLRNRAGLSATAVRPGTNLLPAPAQAWPLSLSEASEYLRQAASALQYAHDRGIIHRDIKPANFLLRVDDGQTVHLLLSDFGLAKFFAASSATSSILGTPTYMAPEQFEGIAGPETDQYALAIMIYLFLAGRAPFEGEPLRLMHQHLMQEPPPIRTFVPTLPQGIELVLTKALAKKPANRYPSIAEFAHTFLLAAREPSSTFAAPPVPPTVEQAKRPATPPASLRLSGSPFAATGVEQQTPDSAPTIIQPYPPTMPPVQPQTAPAFQSSSASTPDSAPSVAQPVWSYEQTPAPNPTPSSASNAARQFHNALPGQTTPDNAPTVIQPGQWTPPQRTGAPQPAQPSWAAEDDNAPTVAQPFLPPPPPQAHTGFAATAPAPPSLPPATNAQTSSSPARYTAAQRASMPPTAPVRQASAPGGPAEQQKVSRRNMLGILAGGAAIVVVGGGVGAYIYSRKQAPPSTTTTTTTGTGANTKTTGAPLIVLQGHTGAVTSVSWSPDGTQLVSSARDNTVRIWSIANQQTVATYSGHQAPVLTAVWSSNGNLLASGSADQSVQVWNTTGATQRSFTGLGTGVSSIVWENGTTLLAGTLGQGDYILSLNNGHIRKGSFNTIIHAMALSPSGQFLALAFGSGEVGIVNLRKQDQDHRVNLLHQHNGAALSLAWSADGTLLASGGADHKAVVLDTTSGTITHTITDHGSVTGVAWEPAGNGRIATACADGHARVWNLNANTHTFYSTGGPATSVSWSASGLAAGSTNQKISIWKV